MEFGEKLGSKSQLLDLENSTNGRNITKSGEILAENRKIRFCSIIYVY